ncbi:hypothetical protein [Pseudoscardovia radai]|uniref:hypothetical protein n=1 Tax=Pseudoscardovia radai TaxID=987066 RepID=UPI0039940464
MPIDWHEVSKGRLRQYANLPDARIVPVSHPITGDWYVFDTGEWRSCRTVHELFRLELEHDSDGRHACARKPKDFTREVAAWKAIGEWEPVVDGGVVSRAWLESKASAYTNRLRQVKGTLWAMVRGPRMSPDEWTMRIRVLSGESSFPEDWADWWKSIDAPHYRRRFQDLRNDDFRTQSAEAPRSLSVASVAVDRRDVLALPGERQTSLTVFFLAVAAFVAITVGYITWSLAFMESKGSFGAFDTPLTYYVLGNGNTGAVLPGLPAWIPRSVATGISTVVFALMLVGLFFAGGAGILLFPYLRMRGHRKAGSYFAVCLYFLVIVGMLLYGRIISAFIQDTVIPSGRLSLAQVNAVSAGSAHAYTFCTLRHILLLAAILLAVTVAFSVLLMRQLRLSETDDARALRVRNLRRRLIAFGVGVVLSLPIAVHSFDPVRMEGAGAPFLLTYLVLSALVLFLCTTLIPGEVMYAWFEAGVRLRARAVVLPAFCAVLEFCIAVMLGTIAFLEGLV